MVKGSKIFGRWVKKKRLGVKDLVFSNVSDKVFSTLVCLFVLIICVGLFGCKKCWLSSRVTQTQCLLCERSL